MIVIETYEPTGTLKPVTDRIWIVDGPVIRFGYGGVKFPFTTRMTVVQLGNGELWVHSPTEFSEALKAEIDALGQVRYLIAPNRIHYWWMDEWVAAYPKATTYAAPGVRNQAQNYNRYSRYDFDLVEGDEYPWSNELSMLIIHGSYLSEAVFFHAATRTLIVVDLIQNYERDKITNPVFRFMSWLSGALDPDGKAPIDLRMTFFLHRKKFAAAVRTMISWQPQRIIIAHGRWYRDNAVTELKRAFRWLPGISR